MLRGTPCGCARQKDDPCDQRRQVRGRIYTVRSRASTATRYRSMQPRTRLAAQLVDRLPADPALQMRIEPSPYMLVDAARFTEGFRRAY